MADLLDVRLTLVSKSPRRAELLRRLDVPFDVYPSRAAEHWLDRDVVSLAQSNARRKVERSPVFGDRSRLLLGADTLIRAEPYLFGKPAGAESAKRMLQCLSGRRHDVTTGVYMIAPAANPDWPAVCVETALTSYVEFHKLTSTQIRAYLDSGEWQGKAGAYAVQGLARDFVAHLEGDFDNVVGLPVKLIHDLLREKFFHCRLC